MVHGVWCVGYECMVHGVWCVVHGGEMHGVQSMVAYEGVSRCMNVYEGVWWRIAVPGTVLHTPLPTLDTLRTSSDTS
jgi:hypothetical protein